MYEPVQKCTHCGANLSLDDLRLPNCRYCGTVFPHHAQAAQHAAMAGQVMALVVAQQAAIQDQWRGGAGVGPMPQGMPGGPPPGMVGPGSPYGDPSQMMAAQMAMAARMSRNIMLWVAISVIGSLLVAGVIVALVLF